MKTDLITKHALSVAGILFACGIPTGFAQAAPQGKALVVIVDEANKQPMPCLVKLTFKDGGVICIPGYPFYNGEFVCDGNLQLSLPAGDYVIAAEHGPAFTRGQSEFKVTPEAYGVIFVPLTRIADPAEEGWYAGDTHIHRPVEEIELHAKAEDLHMAPVITWWNQTNPWLQNPVPEAVQSIPESNRWIHTLGGEDERAGGALLYFNLPNPLDLSGASSEIPTSSDFLKLASSSRTPQTTIEIEKPFWWDMPTWVASGQVDTIGIAHNHIQQNGMLDNEAWGKSRNLEKYPSPLGNALWTQDIYYHLLNSGFRLPPSAGSASGVLKNPVGYNRVYVHVDGELTYEKWWDALKSGKSFVTNGPLLRVSVKDQPPGYVFKAYGKAPKILEIDAKIDSRDPIQEIQVIQNGSVAQSLTLEEFSSNGFKPLQFEASGWFLVRVLGSRTDTFQFASSAPYYVEYDKVPKHLSKSSIQFFVDWIQERIIALESIENPQDRDKAKEPQLEALKIWTNLLAESNAP